ncbi:AraC family transcriptional regulator [Paenibacillus aurantius]|uniref:AraC family transcriptional regulator n=1 Tax=Paenibacillus aurantius TaxID=2918900 RepID=A0AA96RFA4_9BACL|nr:AraC family transcriptional regulator [Paenibacillus aurantius]WJH35762.1 AraC family transcriptional regulator [Paenibacillus sp. CC-CFT747]WNQ11053.1 AraC family transcriptional regulator [Paenibacillus aurantius]
MNPNVFQLVTEEDSRLPFYITSLGRWNNQDPIERKEGYRDFQWIQCLGGEGELMADGKRWTVSKGQGMLLLPNSPHEYRAIREPWEVMWVTFNGKHAADLLAELHFTETSVLYVSNPDTLLSKMHAAAVVMHSKDPMRSFECSSLVYQLILDLYTYGSGSEVRSKQQHYEQLTPVLHYIEDRFDRPISLGELAGQLKLSPQYTCLLFQQTMGLRPFEYITKFRIRKAKEMLLKEQSLSVQEVARKVGYEHPSYFIKLFRTEEGITPSTFRRVHCSSPRAT